jgi:hypothetical protein
MNNSQDAQQSRPARRVSARQGCAGEESGLFEHPEVILSSAPYVKLLNTVLALTEASFNLLGFPEAWRSGDMLLDACSGEGQQFTQRRAREVSPLGKYWRNKPLPFSFVPRGRGYCRSATNTRFVNRWGQPLGLSPPFSPIRYPGFVQQHRHFIGSPVPAGDSVTDHEHRGALSRDVAPCRHRIRTSEAYNHRGDLSWCGRLTHSSQC